MARCAQGAHEFLESVFAPTVAALCSVDAEAVCSRGGLSFVQLLKPFCRLPVEVHVRDPSNQLQPVKNLRLCISALNTQSYPPGVARKLLSDTVSNSFSGDGAITDVVSVGSYDLNINTTTPWFEAYREAFFQVFPVGDHECHRHYLACLLVVSSNHQDPMEQFHQLSQEQHRVQHGGECPHPKWFSPNTLKHYVLLHDIGTGDLQRAEEIYDGIKQLYGSSACSLLRINSLLPGSQRDDQIPEPWSQYMARCPKLQLQRLCDGWSVASNGQDAWNAEPASVPPNEHDGELKTESDYAKKTHLLEVEVASEENEGRAIGTAAMVTHGACLSLEDQERLRQFVQDFTIHGLLPHIERTIRQLNDQLVSRRGLSRSLMTVTRKWFGGSKTPERLGSEPRGPSGITYSSEAPELQLRKMGDLCFLMHLYELAYTCYHSAKKEFQNDQASIHAAGAMEMAAVSAFLQPGNQRQYPAHYMENAALIYRDSCRNAPLAERCTLLSLDVLKSHGQFSDAAAALIRFTSEDSDLQAALFLEQAAHCFVCMRNPLARKFAFHMILAGHRYLKASQRKHSLRCYMQALQVYRGRGWCLAEDHINLTIARQSFSLHQLDASVSAFRHVLLHESRQTPAQQAALLREYLFIYKQVGEMPPEGPLPQLPLPFLDCSLTRLFLGHDWKPAQGEKQAATHMSLDQHLDAEAVAAWQELEELAASKATTTSTAYQPCQLCLSYHTDNSKPPLAVVNEPIKVEVVLRNPLQVPLLLSDLCLHWNFEPKSYDHDQKLEESHHVTNERGIDGISSIESEVLPEFLLPAGETKPVRLQLLPRCMGKIDILGLLYGLSAGLPASGLSGGISTRESQIQPPARPLGNGVSVRGRQELHLQGPRLNSTLEEKTSVVYGPDNRLCPIVTPAMPLLEVFFMKFPSALLCGEVRRTSIEFSNVGPLPLASLVVATHSPEFFTFGSGNSAPNSDLGPYHTREGEGRASVPFFPSRESGSGLVVVPLPGGRLESGQAVSLPFWIRGPDAEGVHEIRLLFLYRSVDEHPKISHRVVRHTAVVCVASSLVASGRITRSLQPPEPRDSRGRDANSGCEEAKDHQRLLVQLNVENLSQLSSSVQQFQLIQVSSASSLWHLYCCLTPSMEGLTVGPKEKLLLHFKAMEMRKNSQEADEMIFSNISFSNEQQVPSWSSPCRDFFISAIQRNLRGRGRSRDVLYHLDRFRKRCQVQFGLIILWKAVVLEGAKEMELMGQHHICLQHLDQESFSGTLQTPCGSTPFLETVTLEKSSLNVAYASPNFSLVRCSFRFSSTIRHSFKDKRLCTLPVVLVLYNCCTDPLHVIVNSSTTPGPHLTQAAFTWVGCVHHRLSLPPLSSHHLPLQACFPQPGVFDLATVHISATTADAVEVGTGPHMDFINQQLPAPAYVVVENAEC
uniref:trafficking protein particle complex subunit 8 isoform X2 n=1 Tax=Myxine glutinosa TaxID=7769 RepID=UPI00358F5108